MARNEDEMRTALIDWAAAQADREEALDSRVPQGVTPQRHVAEEHRTFPTDTFPLVEPPTGLHFPSSLHLPFFADASTKEIFPPGHEYKDGLKFIRVPEATLTIGEETTIGSLAVMKNSPVVPDLGERFAKFGTLWVPIHGSVQLHLLGQDGQTANGSGEYGKGDYLLLPPETRYQIGTEAPRGNAKFVSMAVMFPLKKGQYQALRK